MIDHKVLDIVDRALAGEKIPGEELLPLFQLPTASAEAAHIIWAARTIGERASQGIGQVYAQIGIDGLPCGINCHFCQFAADISPDDAVDALIAKEEIVRYAQVFDDAGVHLIILMSTGGLPFPLLLERVEAVRAALHDDMPLLVNTADLSLEQAQTLKSAGVQGAYHANRIGEGIITQADPATRLQTMQNLQKAGLQLMNAVEPVLADTPAEDILARMEEAAGSHPYCSGVNTLTPIPGTPMADAKPLGKRRAGFFAALMRLLVGTDIPFGAGARNVMWVDAGTNARGRNLPVNPEILQRDVARQRKELSREEWQVPTRPLDLWFR